MKKALKIGGIVAAVAAVAAGAVAALYYFDVEIPTPKLPGKHED